MKGQLQHRLAAAQQDESAVHRVPDDAVDSRGDHLGRGAGGVQEDGELVLQLPGRIKNHCQPHCDQESREETYGHVEEKGEAGNDSDENDRDQDESCSQQFFASTAEFPFLTMINECSNNSL